MNCPLSLAPGFSPVLAVGRLENRFYGLPPAPVRRGQTGAEGSAEGAILTDLNMLLCRETHC
jgi:hypothetical protein